MKRTFRSAVTLSGLVAALFVFESNTAEAQSNSPCSTRYKLAWQMPLNSSDVGRPVTEVFNRSEFSTRRNVFGDRNRLSVGRAPDGTVALQMNIPRGENRSTDFFLDPLGSKGVDTACLSLRVFMESGFEWPANGGTKMGWGLWGGEPSRVSGGTPPNEQRGWSVRNVHTLYGFRHYSYHLNRPARFGHQGRPLARWGTTDWQAGRWHTIELEVVMNSPGSANGYLQLWLDGKNRQSATGLIFRRNSNWAIRGLMFSDIYGGSTSDPRNFSPKAQKMWLADYKLYTGNGSAVARSESTSTTSTSISTPTSAPTSATTSTSSGGAFGPVTPSGTIGASNVVVNWNPDPKADRYYVRVMTQAARWADRRNVFGGSAFPARHCNNSGCSLQISNLSRGQYEWFVRPEYGPVKADYKAMIFDVR